jgi:hypothetical protein
MTARELTALENAIFDDLVQRDVTFVGKLYRDGVPSPALYLNQRVRVLFVFREPNMPVQRDHDMRDEIRDVRFRPWIDGEREDRRPTTWWNYKAGMLRTLWRQPWMAGQRRNRSVISQLLLRTANGTTRW